MSGLLRRIRRPGAAEETRTEPVALPDPAHGSAPTAAPTHADGQPLPAGSAPEDVERRKGAGRRGKLRRRARFLRRARELALRDLGGLVYEAHRREQDGGALVKEKVQHLAALDEELHGLETELGAPRGETVLRQPGVGGTCPRCGELHASDAHFCARCGLDLTAAPAEPAAATEPGTAEAEPAAAPEPAAAKAEEPTRVEEPAAAEAPAAAKAEEPTTVEEPAAAEAPSPQAGNGRRTAKGDAKPEPEPATAETRDRSA